MINTKIKQAHISSNMFNRRAEGKIYDSVYTESSGWETHYYMYMTSLIAVKGGETYTWRISADTSSGSSRLTDITTVYYDKDLNEIGCASHADSVRYYSFTVPQNCAYVRCPTSRVENIDRESMLNVGSSPLPYEEYYAPYYDTVSYAKSITGAQTYTKFPIVLRTKEQSIPTWTIKSNTVQDGTPTRSNPVDVNGVGERTENMYDGSTSATNQRLSTSGTGTYAAQGYSVSSFIEIEPSTYYSLTTGETTYYNLYNENKQYIYGAATNTRIPDSYANARYVRFDFKTENIPSVMLVKGSTVPSSYIPYGYKIPITSGGVTTNIYLGSTQTLRQVKKLVLTGEEDWVENLTNHGYRFGLKVSDSMQSDTQDVRSLCTHLSLTERGGTGLDVQNVYVIAADQFLIIKLSNSDRVSDLKTWLAQQYTNGTPVTVWYVLATPETATVNEPLMKIGTYADSLSNAVSIPTTSGLNTIDVTTTLKPSEMSLTYDGYKLCKGQRYSRTENYLDENDFGLVEVAAGTYRVGTDVGVLPSGNYTFNAIKSSSAVQIYRTTKNGSTYNYETITNLPYTFTADGVSNQIFRSAGNTGSSWADLGYTNVMLNTGSTAKPYQPYLDWE